MLPDSLGFYPATLCGTATRCFLDDGNWAVFTGNSKGYIDLGETIGTDVMSQLKTNYTISLKPTTFGYQLKDNWLGRSPFASDAYMANTYMDNLRIYNTALTAAEVQALADRRPTSKTVTVRGDVNADGVVDIIIIDIILK